MNFHRFDVEIIGSKADKWNEIKNNVVSCNFPEIFPGPGDKFRNKNLELVLSETSDNKVYNYFSEWIKGITPQEEVETLPNGQEKRKKGKFVIIEDAINEASIKFYDNQENELFSHSFKNVYPVRIVTDCIYKTDGSIKRRITFRVKITK